MNWLPIETRPLLTGTYLVGHHGYQEILKFFGPEVEWQKGTSIGWQRLTKDGWKRDDPTERFGATHCVMIDAPPSVEKPGGPLWKDYDNQRYLQQRDDNLRREVERR